MVCCGCRHVDLSWGDTLAGPVWSALNPGIRQARDLENEQKNIKGHTCKESNPDGRSWRAQTLFCTRTRPEPSSRCTPITHLNFDKYKIDDKLSEKNKRPLVRYVSKAGFYYCVRY